MQHEFRASATLAADLTAQLSQLREGHAADPFGNPVLSLALSISRRIDTQELSLETLAGLVAELRDAAFGDRARRIAAYVGGVDEAANQALIIELAHRLIRPDPADSRSNDCSSPCGSSLAYSGRRAR